jgi:hypothetical protein
LRYAICFSMLKFVFPEVFISVKVHVFISTMKMMLLRQF